MPTEHKGAAWSVTYTWKERPVNFSWREEEEEEEVAEAGRGLDAGEGLASRVRAAAATSWRKGVECTSRLVGNFSLILLNYTGLPVGARLQGQVLFL